jgi:hypothetical protein
MPLSETEELELLELENQNALAAQSSSGSVAEPPLTDRIGGAARKAAEVLATPVRGFRGIGVGAQRLMEGDQLGQALDRAAAATKPGFQPKEGERLGASAGEIAATAPMMVLTGGGGLMAQVLKGALSSGALTAVMEASDRGDVEPIGIATSTALGGAIPLLGPSLRVVARALRGTGRAAATSGTSLAGAKEAVDELAADPRLLEKFKGTAASVGEKVKAIQDALIKQHEEAGAILNKSRAAIGFRESFEDSMNRIQREGFRAPTPSEIIADFQILSKDEIPVEVVRKAQRVQRTEQVLSSYEPSEGAMEYAKRFVEIPEHTTETMVRIPPKARLRDLLRLREKVDDLINFPRVSADVPQIGSADQAFLKQLRGKINNIIEGIPGGKDIREADHIYSESRRLYDDFQKSLATQGKAEDIVRQIVRGGDVDGIVGKRGEYVRLLQAIEKKTKKQLLDPARKEFAAKAINEVQPTGWTGVPASALGPGGLANLLWGLNGVAAVPDAAAMPVESRAIRGLLQAGEATQIGRRR